MEASSDKNEPQAAARGGKSLRWGKRLGAAAFLFFLIKGLAWLIVPAVLAYWAVR